MVHFFNISENNQQIQVTYNDQSVILTLNEPPYSSELNLLSPNNSPFKVNVSFNNTEIIKAFMKSDEVNDSQKFINLLQKCGLNQFASQIESVNSAIRPSSC